MKELEDERDALIKQFNYYDSTKVTKIKYTFGNMIRIFL
jgi:hypothetical protein